MIKILTTILLLIIQQFENKITILVNKKYVINDTLTELSKKFYNIYNEKVDIVVFEKEVLLVRNPNLLKKADLVIGVSDLFLYKFSKLPPVKVSHMKYNHIFFSYIKKIRYFIKNDQFIPIGYSDISLISDKKKELKDLDLAIFNPLLSTTGMYMIYFIENNMNKKNKNIILSKVGDMMFMPQNWADAFFRFFNHQHEAVMTFFKDEYNTLNDEIKINKSIPIQNTYLNKLLNRKILYIKNIFYRRPLYIEYLFATSEIGAKFLLMLFSPTYFKQFLSKNYLEDPKKLPTLKNVAIMNSEVFWKKRKFYIDNI